MKIETKEKGRRLLRPLVNLLANIGVSPAVVTIAAIPLSVLAALLFAIGYFFWAGLTVFLIGLCDTLDGELSRKTGRVSSAGALLDSTVDRFSEGVVFAGIGWYYSGVNRGLTLLVFLALLFSYLVSYVRARAEGTGKECTVGFFERPVRVATMVVGGVFLGRRLFFWAVLVIAVGSLITFIHRLVYVLKQRR